MKILNIYFKNINSLEGESRIHFDKAPIVDGGVFAITGPNGSGKSSVLDAITLGLYGETFRFDRPAEHVMTKSTADSFAEVEFELAKDKYKATWRVARADGNASGELLPAEMKLIHLNGSETVLEENVQKVREKMLELTGMDFHKFSKSMVLAQGDFAAFLNALDSERMDILEKISGNDIYQEYAQQAEEKYSQAQIRLQQLEQDLSATPVMDQVAIEASQHDLEDFKEQQTELITEQDEIEQKLNWVQNISSLEKQAVSLEKQQKDIEGQQGDNEKNLDKVKASKNILVFEEDLATLDKKSEAIKQSEKTLDSYRGEVEMLQTQLKSSPFDEKTANTSLTISQQKAEIDQLNIKLGELKYSLPKESTLLQSLEQQKEQQSTALVQLESWIQTHAADKTLLDNFPEIAKLREVRSELSEATEKQSSSSKYISNITKTLENKKKEVKALKQKGEQLKIDIAENETSFKVLADGNSLEELQELKAEQQQRVLDYQELLDLAAVNSKLGKKGFFGQFFGSKNEDKEEALLKKEHELLQLEIGREKNLITTLEAAVSNEALLKKMEADRTKLIDGKACPLCGALEHPYAKHTPAVSNSKQILKDQQKKIKSLVVDEIALSKQIVLAKKQVVQSEQKDDKLKNVCAQWNALANRLNAFSLDLTIENLSLMKNLVKTEKKELNDITNLLKRTSKLQATGTDAKGTIATNEASIERTAKELEGLTAEWENRPKDTDEIEKTYKEVAEREKALSDKVEKQLELLGEKMPKKSKEEAFFKLLNDRKQEYLKQTQALAPLTEEIKKLDEAIKTSSEKINSFNKDIQKYSSDVQQQEGAGAHLALTEKQKLIADKEVAFNQQESELDAFKQSLQEKVKQTAAIDLSALRETLNFVRSEDALQQKHQQLTEKLLELNNKQDELATQLKVEQELAVTTETEYDLTGKKSVVKRKLDIAKQEVLTIQNKLDKQDSLQQKQQGLVDKIADQKVELAVCEADRNSVSSEGNMDFRRKVQQIISDKLMGQTNQILEKISGRYYVRKVESEHGLALEIEDTKQQNVRRLPKTLSGGESFIVSLSLALGLAEMSNNGHAVDSLFLDEGFGNLDAESLYLAMTALENLQTHGKVVGVISHVEGVQKRIKTQIEMSKKPNGLSALKMVS